MARKSKHKVSAQSKRLSLSSCDIKLAATKPLQIDKRAMRNGLLSFCLLGLFMIAGDNIAQKPWTPIEPLYWQVRTKIVSESGFIWEVDE
jgi:hypothetical protein